MLEIIFKKEEAEGRFTAQRVRIRVPNGNFSKVNALIKWRLEGRRLTFSQAEGTLRTP